MAYQARVFDEGLVTLLKGDFDPTDVVSIAIVTTALVPTTIQVDPRLTDFTEVSDAGTYTLGGMQLGLLGNLVTTAGGVLVFDSPVNPSWAQDSSNGIDAGYGIIYNSTSVNKNAFGFVDLMGPVDMAQGTLAITWPSTGIFRISRPA
jgi:hypothetical protein